MCICSHAHCALHILDDGMKRRQRSIYETLHLLLMQKNKVICFGGKDQTVDEFCCELEKSTELKNVFRFPGRRQAYSNIQ